MGACGAWAGDAGGRTRTGRRGGAGGACPVLGSSTLKRSVGGTTRPVGDGPTLRGASVDAAGAAGSAAVVSGAWAAIDGSSHGRGADTGTGASSTSGSVWKVSGSSTGACGIAAGTRTSSAAAGGAAGSSGGAGGLAVFTSRGGGSEGATGLAGSGALPPGFFPLTGAGESANDAFEGTLRPRWRARRPTNSRATTSSIVLDALLTSMPWSRLSSAITS